MDVNRLVRAVLKDRDRDEDEQAEIEARKRSILTILRAVKTKGWWWPGED